MTGNVSEDAILRAKYLDWCSARIAERFLALSPDEIYQLAERATQGPVPTPSPYASLSSSNAQNADEPDWHQAIDEAVAVADPDNTPYAVTIARVTEVLADEMELPTLHEWSVAYTEAPEEFDADMLGFWKEKIND